ncbi:MAG: UPF0175 family protein [Pirellulaceae bacterium]
MQVAIDLPDDCLKAMKLPTEEVPARLKRELALRLYRKELLSFGKARQLAGMTRWEFHDLLGTEGVERHYGSQELNDDIVVLEELD